ALGGVLVRLGAPRPSVACPFGAGRGLRPRPSAGSCYRDGASRRRAGPPLRSRASLRPASTSTTDSVSSRPLTCFAVRSAQALRAAAGSAAGTGLVRRRASSQRTQPIWSWRSAVSVKVQRAASSSTARLCGPSPVGRHSLSLCRSVFSRVIGVSQWFRAVFGAVEGQERRLALDDRLQVNRPAPDELDVGQDVGRPVQL